MRYAAHGERARELGDVEGRRLGEPLLGADHDRERAERLQDLAQGRAHRADDLPLAGLRGAERREPPAEPHAREEREVLDAAHAVIRVHRALDVLDQGLRRGGRWGREIGDAGGRALLGDRVVALEDLADGVHRGGEERARLVDERAERGELALLVVRDRHGLGAPQDLGQATDGLRIERIGRRGFERRMGRGHGPPTSA
jgi:hypothetical protein